MSSDIIKIKDAVELFQSIVNPWQWISELWHIIY